MRKKENKRIVLDEYQKKVLTYVENGENLFITGNAGTGKTALLREITTRYKGKNIMAVLAPTGVAAKNAGGITMHNFLRIPLEPFLPDYKIDPNKIFRLNYKKEELLRSLDVIIIDEVSMVRCDTLDAADAILRHYRNNDKPFGGVQLVMFGDLYQLPPVADTEQRKLLKECYNVDEFYFFYSKALQKIDYRVIRLKKIHRQDNREFINLLNNVRTGDINLDGLKLLNTRVDGNIKHTPTDETITLTTHNYQSNNINWDMYNMLDAPEYTYTAKIMHITDDWHEEKPVAYNLKLKVGARVMFLRKDSDDDLYVNGTMGWVHTLSEHQIIVLTDDGYPIVVKRAVWQQYDYYIDRKKKILKTEVSAEYRQYPLQLAWAVSIHKSQGLTLNKLNIDASKAFTFGQVYVALSRCKTLEGIHLLHEIPSQKIIADDIVKRYFESVDENGYAHLPKENEEEYEKEPLELEIKPSSFENIIIKGVKKTHGLIRTEKDARKFFVQNGDGSYRPDKPWIGKVKLTNYWTMFGLSCPYLMKKYRKAILINRSDRRRIEVDIVGKIDIKATKDALGNPRWRYDFRFSNSKLLKGDEKNLDLASKIRKAALYLQLKKIKTNQ